MPDQCKSRKNTATSGTRWDDTTAPVLRGHRVTLSHRHRVMVPGWKDSTGADPSPLFPRLPASVRSMGTILTPVTIWIAFLCLVQTARMG